MGVVVPPDQALLCWLPLAVSLPVALSPALITEPFLSFSSPLSHRTKPPEWAHVLCPDPSAPEGSVCVPGLMGAGPAPLSNAALTRLTPPDLPWPICLGTAPGSWARAWEWRACVSGLFNQPSCRRGSCPPGLPGPTFSPHDPAASFCKCFFCFCSWFQRVLCRPKYSLELDETERQRISALTGVTHGCGGSLDQLSLVNQPGPSRREAAFRFRGILLAPSPLPADWEARRACAVACSVTHLRSHCTERGGIRACLALNRGLNTEAQSGPDIRSPRNPGGVGSVVRCVTHVVCHPDRPPRLRGSCSEAAWACATQHCLEAARPRQDQGRAG